MASRRRPLFVDVVGLNPLSGMRSLLVSREATTKKEKQSKNVDIEVRSRTRLWPVCTPYRTLSPVFGTPVEAVFVTSRHWQEFVDIAVISYTLLTGHTFSSREESGSFSGRNVGFDQTMVAGLRFRLVRGQQCAECPGFWLPAKRLSINTQ